MEVAMRVLSRIVPFIPCLVAVLAPAYALDADLARKCRALMIKAHPIEVFGSAGSAAAQRVYFQDCIRKGGEGSSGADNKDKSRPTDTTGQ
jgi:hypothetical protein